MRRSVLALLLSLACLLGRSPHASAQPPTHFLHAAALSDAVARVETEWSSGSRGRSARVEARVGEGPVLVLHDGATVRTAVAGDGERLCVVVYHGGDDDPFARALLAHRDGDHLVLDHTVTIPSALATADRRPRFPADALVAATPRGFAVMVQHQERDPSADVVTTLTVLGADGTEIEATHRVAVPWALGALVRDGEGYQLAVLWGGWGSSMAGTARVCLVHLSATGEPTEHPWWASPAIAVGDVHLLRTSDGATTAAWLDEDGVVVGHRWPSPGGWSVEPPAPETIGTPASDAVAWTLVERDGRAEVVAAR